MGITSLISLIKRAGHTKILTDLPSLKPGEQTVLMKEAIVNYFDGLGFFK